MRNHVCLLLLVLSTQLFGQNTTNNSRITIREQAISVSALLDEISYQSGADFTYNSRVIDPATVVSFKVRKASLEETLDQLSETLQVRYSLVEGQIILNFEEKVEPPQFYTISGFLADQSSGESLISATVALKGTGQGVFTNEFGYYALTLEEGTYTLRFSYLGYEDREVQFNLDQDTRQNVLLPPATIGLPAVVVRPNLNDVLQKRQADALTLTPAELGQMPELAGESGLVKGLQTLAGVKGHSDGSAFFFTRGGERDQNLVIIDDAPIFNPSHMLGFYSLVIPDFAKEVQIYKSDMPVSMGDRLSTIVSIRTKDGNLNQGEFNAALGPFINRISLETPIKKERSSLFLSARRSNFEWLYRANAEDLDLHFQDFQLKFNYKVNENNRLFFTSIQSGDVFENRSGPVNGLRWGNLASTLRWNHIFNSRLFLNAIFYTGSYSYNLRVSPNNWKSQLSTASLKADFTHYSKRNSISNFGLEIQNFFNDPGSLTLDSTIAIIPEIGSNSAQKIALYYQGKFQLNDKLQLKTGLRLTTWNNWGPKTYYSFDDNYIVNDTLTAGAEVYSSFFNADPRLSLQYQLDSTSLLKLSYGTYHQYLQQISNSISPFTAFEIWLPASPNIEPQYAAQWALSYYKRLPETDMELTTVAYYKRMRNQIDYAPYPSIYLNPLLEGELRFGEAEAYGLELTLKKTYGRLNGWVSYTYSRVFRQFDNINNGEPYQAFQDRPHDLSIVLNYRLKDRVHFSANWISQSGSPFTSPTGFYRFNGQNVPIYGERNNDRLPSYRRLDVAWQFILNRTNNKRYRHSLTFSIYNALAHKNVFNVKFNKVERTGLNPPVEADVLDDEVFSPSQIELVRFFPSLTYKIKI
ncbi:MAG: TonB-dependent receptor [Bacteroidota bacterium]